MSDGDAILPSQEPSNDRCRRLGSDYSALHECFLDHELTGLAVITFDKTLGR
jgi:hypothetical protein